MSDTLLIAEHPGHVEALRAEGLLDRSGTRVLAATACARYACEGMGVRSVCPEDFYSEAGLNEAGDWVTTLLAELERRLDPMFLEWLPELRRLAGAGPVGLAWWELHRLISPHAAAVHVLKRVTNALKPSRVVCFTGPPECNYLLDYPISSPWPGVLALLGRQQGIIIEERPEPDSREETVVSVGRKPAGAWLSQLRRLGRPWLGVVDWLVSGCPRANPRLAPVLVVGASGEDVKALMREAVHKGTRPVWLWDMSGAPLRISPPRFRRLETPHTLQGAPVPFPFWPRLSAERWFLEAMTCEGVGLSDALSGSLSRFCDQKVPDLARTMATTETVLDRLMPGAVVTAFAHRREHVVQRLAILRGIPAVEYNHGAGLMASSMEAVGSPLAYHRGWRWSSHVLAQGDGVRDYMEKWHGVGDKTIPVGSAHLDRVRIKVGQRGARRKALRALGLDESSPVVLYVTSSSEGVVRFPPHRTRSSNRQWWLDERILAAAASCPGIQLVVKAYPRDDFPIDRTPIEEAIRDRGYRNCRVLRRVPLETILAAADLFIADCPSLSFFEMLTTERPIVLCGWEMPWPFTPVRWHPTTIPMWKERVLYLESLEDIDKALPELFRRLPLPPSTDGALLRTFGTHRDDGRSAERAWRTLGQIMELPAAPSATCSTAR